MNLKPMSTYFNETAYNEYNSAAIIRVNEYLVKTLKQMHQRYPERFEKTDQPFTLAEFGCSTGRGSILPLRTIIETVRGFNPKMEFVIYLNDLPSNHHELAIKTICDGLKDLTGYYVYIAGADFTKTVFPENFLDFGFSYFAVATLPGEPARLDNCSYYQTDELMTTEDGRKWAEAYHKFVTSFIASRKKELRPHGSLFILT